MTKKPYFYSLLHTFYLHYIPGDCVQCIQFLLFSLQRTKGIKVVEWFVKKSQVLGEIGRHYSIIGLGKALLNPCLDGRTECEIWEAFWSRWFSCSLASLHFLLFWKMKTEKWKAEFSLSFILSNYSSFPIFSCTAFHNYQLAYLNVQTHWLPPR